MSYARQRSAKKILEQLNAALQRYPGWMDAQISHIADLVVEDAQDNARKRTGRMANMTVKEQLRKGSEIGYRVVGKAPYTIFQHEGTKWITADPYIQNALNKYVSRLSQIDFAAFLKSGGSGSGGSFETGW